MAKGFAKVANALAIGLGGLAQGYGKGTMEVALNARDQYQQQLREQRAAAAAAEERTWREGEAEKGREFEREQFGTEMDWQKEKFMMEQSAQEKAAARSLQNQLTLEKMRQSGRREKDLPAGLQEVEYIAGVMARQEGVDKPTDKHRMAAFEKVNARATSSGGSVPADIKIADELAARRAASEGREVTAEDRLRELEKLTAGAKPTDIARAIKSEYDARNSPLHPGFREWRNMSEEDKQKVAGAAVFGTYEAAGAKVPEEFAKRYRQQSEAEAPQSQTQPAPATSTQGDKPKDATPPGAGTKESPYMATTEEQQRWVIENAPSGAFVSDGTRIFRKP